MHNSRENSTEKRGAQCPEEGSRTADQQQVPAVQVVQQTLVHPKCTERHGEMAEYMQRVGEKPTELPVEEHNQLSDAHKQEHVFEPRCNPAHDRQHGAKGENQGQ